MLGGCCPFQKLLSIFVLKKALGSSEAINRSSEVVRGHQRLLIDRQRSSKVVEAINRSSEVVEAINRSSEAINRSLEIVRDRGGY